MVRFTVLLAFIALLIACDSSEVGKEKKSVEPFIVKQDSNYLLYNEQFAERFNLPVDGVVRLDDGLFAIGLHLGANQNDPSLLNCTLKLYIDSKLDVATPTDSRGNLNRWSVNSEAGFFISKDTSDKEIEWFFDKYLLKSANTLRVISRRFSDDATRGGLSDTGILSYDKEFLKGVAYIASNVSCDALGNDGIPYEVHIKKSNYKGPFGPSTPGYDFENQPESLIRFNIPNRLIYAVIPIIEKDYKEYVKRVEAGLDKGVEQSDGPRFIVPPMVDFSEEG